MKKFFGFFGIILLLSCSQQAAEIITITGEKDLIPEGIAVAEDKIFISSILKNKIVQIGIENSEVSDFIESGKYGFKSGIGLFLKNNLLFALTNSSIASKDSANGFLFVFDITEKKLLKTYELNDNRQHLWNDLAVDHLNQIFITDTKQHKVYRITYPNEKIEDFFSDSTTIYPNGIALSKNNEKLFIASDKYGIRILDIQSKKIINEVSKNTAGIDGMKFFNGNLYAIKNTDKDSKQHGLFFIKLTEPLNGIEKIEPILIAHPLMNVPTTLDIRGEFIYLLGNSQMDNLNQETLQVINKSELTNTYLLKIKIKSGG
jgi:WD40 repeat protein